MSLQLCYGRPFLSRPHREVLVHCRCELGSALRFDSRCFLLCGQVEKSSLGLFTEGCVLAIWAFSVVHKLHLSVVGEYGCAFSRIFHVTLWSALLSFSFQMWSLSDVGDSLSLSLKLDLCWYIVLGYSYVYVSLIVLVCVTVAW